MRPLFEIETAPGVIMNHSRRTLAISLVLGAHVAIDLWVLLGPRPDEEVTYVLLTIAWPMSQGSLVALWAAVSRVRSYLRFLLAVLGLSCTWLLLIALVNYDFPDPGCARLAAMFIGQALTIVLLTTASRLVWRQIHAAQTDDARRRRELQYDLATLVLWTVSLAVTLGLGRLLFTQLGWTAEEVLGKGPFFFTILFGVFNGVYALLVLASLVGRAWWALRVCLALVFVGGLGYYEPFLLEWLTGEAGGISPQESLVIAGLQIAYLYATLLPLRLCGCFGVIADAEPPVAASTSTNGDPPVT